MYFFYHTMRNVYVFLFYHADRSVVVLCFVTPEKFRCILFLSYSYSHRAKIIKKNTKLDSKQTSNVPCYC